MLPKKTLTFIESGLSKSLGKEIKIANLTLVSGGDINEAGKLATNQGAYFIKWNDALKYPKMFDRELMALEAINKTSAILAPQTIFQGEFDRLAFLVMEYIDSGSNTKKMWETFGNHLAHLHMHTNDRFGYHFDNYIGYLPQVNETSDNWIDFFIQRRLGFQSKMAFDNGLLKGDDLDMLDQLYIHLPGLIPEENPAFVHGDLWSGNYMVNTEGQPILIDPAIYYGHREVDLSMMRLFGGFDDVLYDAYHDAFPLQPGFEMRIDIHNLYPLLVHVNLFGASYLSAVRSILKKYS